MNNKIVFVTGASKGIGLEIVLAALASGYTVIGTSRKAAVLEKEVADRMGSQAYQFTAMKMNFDEESIHATIAKVIEQFGRIDILINNAGYALLGAVEEFALSEVRQNFDVNFFGLLNVIQEVLPFMRQQQSGRIINLASISGTVTGPTQGIYSATKAAVIMLSEALNMEVAPFNIHVTAICPGGVRTNFLDQSSLKQPTKVLNDYQVVRETMDGFSRLNRNQSGDPKLVAQAILETAEMTNPPQRLYLGSGALGALQYKLDQIVNEASRFVELSQSIDMKD